MLYGKVKWNFIIDNSVPSHTCRKAKAAAAAESSEVLIPHIRIFMTEDKKDDPLGASLSHFEYAPIVKHTEKVEKHKLKLMLQHSQNLKQTLLIHTYSGKLYATFTCLKQLWLRRKFGKQRHHLN